MEKVKMKLRVEYRKLRRELSHRTGALYKEDIDINVKEKNVLWKRLIDVDKWNRQK